MKFIIYKSSDVWDNEQQPCEGAIRDVIRYPTKHRILDENNNWITQVDIYERYIWIIEINTLEELIELQNSVKNEIIIGHHFMCPDMISIEIYDDYRE